MSANQINLETKAYIDSEGEFRQVRLRGFLERIMGFITQNDMHLLSFDEVVRKLLLQDTVYTGLQDIPIAQIKGSTGRYQEFTRHFLPYSLDKRDKERWRNVYTLAVTGKGFPPIDVYQIDQVYFVKDGNHRISVARQREQEYIDAYVTEISVPIPITTDTAIDDIRQKKEYAYFLQETNLHQILPNVDLQLSTPHEYTRLKEHIRGHRYLMSQQQGFEMSYEVAVASWYEHFYRPLTNSIITNDLPKQFPQNTITDMYLWVSEYQWLLREWYRGNDSLKAASQQLASIYNETGIREVIRTLRQSRWIDEMILQEEQAEFFEQTNWREILPETPICVTAPGNYEKLRQHINAHQWYLGEEKGRAVRDEEALVSWFAHIYQPAIQHIREQGLLENFPERTEADLYLWTIDNRDRLQERDTYLKQVEMALAE